VALRRLEVARVGYALALLAAPRHVQALLGVPVDSTSTAVVRVLGARHLAQGLLSGPAPSPEVLAMGVWVDAAHATTALALAVVDRSRARAGLLDGVLAGSWAVAGYRDLVTGGGTRHRHDRVRDMLARAVLRRLPGGRRLLTGSGAA
jgi:hypothetical protein